MNKYVWPCHLLSIQHSGSYPFPPTFSAGLFTLHDPIHLLIYECLIVHKLIARYCAKNLGKRYYCSFQRIITRETAWEIARHYTTETLLWDHIC